MYQLTDVELHAALREMPSRAQVELRVDSGELVRMCSPHEVERLRVEGLVVGLAKRTGFARVSLVVKELSPDQEKRWQDKQKRERKLEQERKREHKPLTTRREYAQAMASRKVREVLDGAITAGGSVVAEDSRTTLRERILGGIVYGHVNNFAYGKAWR